MGTTDASKQWYKIVPLHFDMAAEVRYQAIDRDLRIAERHRGDGSNCKLGHVRADLVGFFEVNFPVEPERDSQCLALAFKELTGCKYPKV